MERYREDRNRTGKASNVMGIALTLLVHLCAVLCLGFTGLKYLYPPPQEKTILIEFDEIPQQDPIQVRTGTQPQAPDADPQKDINLVQKSEAQHHGEKANMAPEATVGDKGDVEVPEPPREKEINRRALFHAADNQTEKDTLAPQTAYDPSDELKAGHASGNTKTGKTNGEPNAKVKGRSIVGTLPSPVGTGQAQGVVVVDIWVDQYGTVTKAIAGGEGTTLTDSEVWQKARNAALGAHFSMAADAPPLQQGTITYVFKLK